MSDVPPLPGRDTFTREQMQKIARLVDEQLPQGWAFIVIAAPFEKAEGRVNYVSNAKRQDVQTLLTNFLQVLKEGGFGVHSDRIV